MTYFADLTPYTYLEEGGPALNVGWLDAVHAFPTGKCPDELVTALSRLAENRVQQTRGRHHCELCLQALGPNADLDGIARGSAELRVPGEGVVYAAPDLLVHYVTAHDYLPPAEFREAVLKQ
jgi:hypothetical protein